MTRINNNSLLPPPPCLNNATAPRFGAEREKADVVVESNHSKPTKFTPPHQRKISITCIQSSLKYLAFKVAAIFKLFLQFMVGTVLVLLGGLPAALGNNFAKEMFWNGILCLKEAASIASDGLKDKTRFNSFNLLDGAQGNSQSEYSWHLNLGLLRNAYERTDDPVLKKQIRFLAANYLAKAAPIHRSDFSFLDTELDEATQITPFESSCYHRWSCLDKENKKRLAKINEQLALGEKSPLILTDTDELSASFKLGYTLFTPASPNILQQCVEAHIERCGEDLFNQPLNLLFDLTATFQNCIQDKTKKIEAEAKLEEVKRTIESMADEAAARYPHLDSSKLRKFILNHVTCIARVKFDGFAGIKLLPLGSDNFQKKQDFFMRFIYATGLYINRVNQYRHLVQDQVFEKNTHYTVQGSQDTQYFTQIEDFTRNYEPFGTNEKPYVQILGNGTLNVLKGWVQEVGQQRWEQLNQNHVLREILNASLYKIKIQIATAQLQKDHINQFTQAIELIQAELVTLMELAPPFDKEAFSTIYRGELTIIPDSLIPHVKAGIGKTAMNVYAAIHSAISKTVENPIKAHCTPSYFEIANFLDQSNSVENTLADVLTTKIDLYATEFNANIEATATHTNYKVTDVAGDIRRLLEAKPDTRHLTISVDCTIDYLNSPKVCELLLAFEPEIQSGKLNFVFSRSGQKFEMLGMDNYYGCPYYLVNNGGPQWEAFNHLTEDPAYQPDPLSVQWFCLANRYASDSLEAYRDQIFQNSRHVLNQVPESLKPRGNPLDQKIRVNTVEESMDPSFVDIKLTGPLHRIRAQRLVREFHYECAKKGVKSDSRASFGFYHPNLVLIAVHRSDQATSIRISPGLSQEENQAIVAFYENLTRRA